jgi:hypothetical protein
MCADPQFQKTAGASMCGVSGLHNSISAGLALRLAAMSLQRKSLVAFLNLAKNSLSTAIQRSTPITFVVGNESAGESLARSVLAASGLEAAKIINMSYSSLKGLLS